jgi:solute carrier family 25 protein 16
VRLAFETKHGGAGFFETMKRIYGEHPAKLAPPPAITSSSVTSASAQATQKVIAKTADSIIPKGGMSNFYRGFSPTILGMLPYAGMSFLTHDTAGDLLRRPLIKAYTTLPRPANYPPNKPDPLRSWAELAAGGIAGLVSQTSSYPLEVIRRRMQVGGAVGDGHRLRIGETAGLIWKESGWRGFWIGLSIGYAKVVPMVAVSFYTYERAKTWLGI